MALRARKSGPGPRPCRRWRPGRGWGRTPAGGVPPARGGSSPALRHSGFRPAALAKASRERRSAVAIAPPPGSPYACRRGGASRRHRPFRWRGPTAGPPPPWAPPRAASPSTPTSGEASCSGGWRAGCRTDPDGRSWRHRASRGIGSPRTPRRDAHAGQGLREQEVLLRGHAMVVNHQVLGHERARHHGDMRGKRGVGMRVGARESDGLPAERVQARCQRPRPMTWSSRAQSSVTRIASMGEHPLGNGIRNSELGFGISDLEKKGAGSQSGTTLKAVIARRPQADAAISMSWLTRRDCFVALSGASQ